MQWYTGSRQVDIVTHSLGVTIARRFMELYPSLARDVVAFVGIAGANHGTSVCRGLDTSYYGCNEIAPGTAWLANLNAHGESPGPTRWMTILNGTDSIDPLFADPQDWQSPELNGADNVLFPTDYHNDLRVGHQEVDTYLPFLLRHGQGGPDAAANGAAQAAAIEAQGTSLDGTKGPIPTLCGVTKLTGGDPSNCPKVSRASTTDTTTSSPTAGVAGASSGSSGSRLSLLPDTAGPDRSPVAPLVALVGAAVLTLTGRHRRRRRRAGGSLGVGPRG